MQKSKNINREEVESLESIIWMNIYLLLPRATKLIVGRTKVGILAIEVSEEM